mgnify:CR=1 FL=1
MRIVKRIFIGILVTLAALVVLLVLSVVVDYAVGAGRVEKAGLCGQTAGQGAIPGRDHDP